jgi:hypothetical protein
VKDGVVNTAIPISSAAYMEKGYMVFARIWFDDNVRNVAFIAYCVEDKTLALFNGYSPDRSLVNKLSNKCDSLLANSVDCELRRIDYFVLHRRCAKRSCDNVSVCLNNYPGRLGSDDDIIDFRCKLSSARARNKKIATISHPRSSGNFATDYRVFYDVPTAFKTVVIPEKLCEAILDIDEEIRPSVCSALFENISWSMGTLQAEQDAVITEARYDIDQVVICFSLRALLNVSIEGIFAWLEPNYNIYAAHKITLSNVSFGKKRQGGSTYDNASKRKHYVEIFTGGDNEVFRCSVKPLGKSYQFHYC